MRTVKSVLTRMVERSPSSWVSVGIAIVRSCELREAEAERGREDGERSTRDLGDERGRSSYSRAENLLDIVKQTKISIPRPLFHGQCEPIRAVIGPLSLLSVVSSSSLRLRTTLNEPDDDSSSRS
jgi:hypothetical protein